VVVGAPRNIDAIYIVDLENMSNEWIPITLISLLIEDSKTVFSFEHRSSLLIYGLFLLV